MKKSAVKDRFHKAESNITARDIQKFNTALATAMQLGNEEFNCPLCGGSAWYSRSKYNGHLHAGCKDCNFTLIE